MIRNIALKIASKKAERARKKKAHTSFADAKKIGILVESENIKSVLNPISEQLKAEGKEVIAIVLDTPSKEHKPLPKNCIRVTVNEFTQLGKIANAKLQSFLKTEFDFLFSLNSSPTLLVQNILANTSARCRVGVYAENNVDFCDFMVAPSPNDDLKGIAKRILKYSKEIR